MGNCQHSYIVHPSFCKKTKRIVHASEVMPSKNEMGVKYKAHAYLQDHINGQPIHLGAQQTEI